MPPKKLSGMETTSAHGHEMTRKIRPRLIQSENIAPGMTSGGITASARAANTTTGVYMCANFVMKFSVGAFWLLAFCIRSRIFETVDSPKTFVTSTVRSPLLFMEPDSTSLPSSTSRGSDSPVRAEVSSEERPSTTLPSRGIFSPGFTTIKSPMATSSGVTRRIPPSVLRFA